jgi:DNA-directed RNA polymerase subunit RPC12/RpoP
MGLEMMLSMPGFKCSTCGATMPRRPKRPWVCPACSGRFQISQTYRQIVAWSLIGILVCFFALLGLRGWRLFIVAIVIWFPVPGLSIPILYRLFLRE